jgi:hypothetical protein
VLKAHDGEMLKEQAPMNHAMLRLFDGSDGTSPALRGEVKALQTALSKYGFGLQADGLFGRDTEAAVRQFQLEHNLLDDGVVGPLTWAALTGDAIPSPDGIFLTTILANDASMLRQLTEARKYKQAVALAAAQFSLPAAVIAGIASRESAWGLMLLPKKSGPAGTGDFAPRKCPTACRQGALPPDNGGFGRGLMQIDFDAHEFARIGSWKDPEQNIKYGCGVLKDTIALLTRKSHLQGKDLLRAGIAAYNCGAGNVLRAIQDGRDFDFYTAQRNYSADVLNRAGFFQAHGWD